MSREIEGRSAPAKATAPRASRRGTKKAQARKLSGLGFRRRRTDSFAPARTPATLVGLTVYPPDFQHGVFSARVGVPEM
jgi:hypothetical protein